MNEILLQPKSVEIKIPGVIIESVEQARMRRGEEVGKLDSEARRLDLVARGYNSPMIREKAHDLGERAAQLNASPLGRRVYLGVLGRPLVKVPFIEI